MRAWLPRCPAALEQSAKPGRRHSDAEGPQTGPGDSRALPRCAWKDSTLHQGGGVSFLSSFQSMTPQKV